MASQSRCHDCGDAASERHFVHWATERKTGTQAAVVSSFPVFRECYAVLWLPMLNYALP